MYQNLISALGADSILKEVEIKIKVLGENPEQVYHEFRDKPGIDEFELDPIMILSGCKNSSGWSYNGPYYKSEHDLSQAKVKDNT